MTAHTPHAPCKVFVCADDEHHWVSIHEPHAPIWIIRCSLCGRHDFDSMLEGWAPPRPDAWCREESCEYRYWRSGSMPTHKRGESCPDPTPETPKRAQCICEGADGVTTPKCPACVADGDREDWARRELERFTTTADALIPFIEQVKVEAWSEGFKVGTEAGARWMENGGSDDDDVNPYRDSQPEPPEIFPGTRAALDGLTVRAADGSGRHFMDDLQPVKCEICGRTMPRGIADDPERHSCAKTLEPREDA